MPADKPLVLAITGASGAPYALRLIEVLIAAGRNVHVTISDAGREVLRTETGRDLNTADYPPELVTFHHYRDYSAGIASGSFLTAGMVICPCSTDTLAAVANGLATNLVHRAASVHLKERRKLIVVPRETPLSVIHLHNMARLAEAGAVILPAMPGFYHGAKTIDDLVNFIVARICDQLEVPHGLMNRWGH